VEIVSAAEPEAPPAAPIADGVSHSLDPRYVALERQVGWIATAVLTLAALAGLGVFLLMARPGWAGATLVGGLMAAGLVAFAWWQQAWPPLEYRHASYRVDANGLEIRRGVYFRAVTNVPRSRVQHTDVAQGPLQRRFGLATLIVHTAGTESAVVELPGLTHEIALAIRDHLLPGRSDDAV
jgi:membrane protein YdbS with pleckstrin-like domain